MKGARLCKGAYEGETHEERELIDITLSTSGHDSFASWFEAMSFDGSEMPNTPRDSWADHLFCHVVNEGSRPAPFALK